MHFSVKHSDVRTYTKAYRYVPSPVRTSRTPHVRLADRIHILRVPSSMSTHPAAKATVASRLAERIHILPSSMSTPPAAKATVASRLVAAVITTTCIISYATAFQSPASQLRVPTAAAPHTYRARSTSLANVSDGEGPSRRTVLGAGLFGGIFGNGSSGAANAAVPPTPPAAPGSSFKPKGPTNEVVKVVNGMKRRRLGGSDIVVSELGLGTQRWVSVDHNAPDEKLCFDFMDEAILKSGVNLLDTAEQYPIPSGIGSPEGSTEECIGKWLKERKGSVKREDVVIATKLQEDGMLTHETLRRTAREV